MKFFRTHKKVAVAGLAATVALVAGGVAFAYFSGGGTGQGSAQVGSASALSITQVGAAYDSLITSNAYAQDQCFTCGDSLTEFGNSIHLGTTGELSDVVVAVRNWGDGFSGEVTFNIYNPSNLTTPIAADTQTFNINQATVDTGNTWTPSSVPSVTNLTFDFSSQDVTLPSNVVYGISYGSEADFGNVNVALSSSANLTVGSDPSAGYVWVLSPYDNPLAFNNDANSCSGDTTPGAFSPEYVWCGFNANNPGAYGNPGGQGADIPAVEFNVVGGGVPALFPGDPAQPIEYAITNPGAAQQVNSVTATIRTDSGDGYVETWNGANWIDVPGCYAEWFQINNSPQALNDTLTGNSTTIFGSTLQAHVAGNVLSIQMLNGAPGAGPQNQNACEGATLGLVFSSN